MLIAVAGLCLTACKNTKGLETPQVVKVSNTGVVSWRAVEKADGYELRVNNVVISCTETSFNLLKTSDLPANGQFTVRVRTVKGDKRSDWSELKTYVHKTAAMPAPDLQLADGKFTWTANTQATKVIVTVNGVATEYPAETTQYDASNLQKDSVFAVKFVGDNSLVFDSVTSAVIYNGANEKLGLVTPQNVRIDGYELTFDPVFGADVYYLLDVANNITTITTNSCDMSRKYLIKSVWACSADGKYENSGSADVLYFTKGSGTQTDPYLIGSPVELRFVEYYESLGQSNYYKFSNDVVLPSYAPGEEEVYNNLYNMGSLSGVIDGDGYKLSNSVVYFCDGYSSLFDSVMPSGVIKNLVIDNANFRTWTNMTNDGIMHEKGGECAILTYRNRGTIDNITVIDSYVYAAKDGAAALVSVNQGTISNCVIESTAHIYGANEAGGIAIFNSGAISNCINRADVAGETTVGGIVGRNNGTVSQCGNEGTITANTFGGGIVGYNYNVFDEELLYDSTISQCYNYGDVNVVSYGGGVVGKNGGDGINEVGKLSYANAGVISCYNTGAVSGANSIGGIVGDNYGYHEAATDLGVVNCCNTGVIAVDVNRLLSTRVFISIENCSSWATDGNAIFYMYYWGVTGGVSWPGARMTPIEVDGETYYYADMNIQAEQLNGVLFTRFDPITGDEWNKTQDIVGRRTTGNLLFKMDGNWKTATVHSSEDLVRNAPLSAGGIAGYSNMINDCYYLVAEINGSSLAAGAALGAQENKIFINGTEAESNACQIEASRLSTLASTLNAYADVWVDGENGPVLQWQRRG